MVKEASPDLIPYQEKSSPNDGSEFSVKQTELQAVARTLTKVLQHPMPMLPNPEQPTKNGERTWFDVRIALPGYESRRVYAVAIVTQVWEDEIDV